MFKQFSAWRQWTILVILLVVLCGTAFLSFFVAQKSRQELAQFTELELPLFDKILTLQSNFTMQESELYSYYVTTDRDDFLDSFQIEKQELNQVLSTLNNQLPNSPIVSTINQNIKKLWLISGRFDDVMNNRPIDWDEARIILSEFAPLAAKLSEENKRLSKWMREVIVERSHESNKLTQITLWITTLIASFSLLAAAAMAWLNARRIIAHQEQKRLSSFPERSPLPIISITDKGEVNYANAHAKNLVWELFESEDIQKLLPQNLTNDLATAKNRRFIEKEYPASMNIFNIMLHWLEDFNEYHIYLTDVTETRKAHERLKELAFYDHLTGLPNLSSFHEDYKQTRFASSSDIEFVCLIEIMMFDRVISTAGHKVSDSIVLDCADRLNEVLCCIDCTPYRLYRFDSNRFCLSIKTSELQLSQIFSNCLETLETPFKASTYEFYLSLNIGATQITQQNSANTELLLKEADSALQEVKHRSKNHYKFYDPSIHEKQLTKLAIETNLRHAMERNELHLAFQAQLCLSSGRIIGAEALLRWHHDDQSISPADFIPIAEESGLIIEIGEWVIKKTCEYAKDFNQQSDNALVIAINVSAKQLVYGNLVNVITKSLRDTGLSASSLEIEITESAMMADFNQALTIIEKIRYLGIKISLDDFGTGYSSLSYLHRLPINKLKIDQSFINNMTNNERDASITHSIITLAKSLQLTVIGEGIEDSEQLNQLQKWGCNEIQGFLFARPETPENFMSLVKTHHPIVWLENQNSTS